MKNFTPLFYAQQGLHVEIYDQMTETGWGNLQQDVPFYLEEAQRADGPILELACGTGRVTLPLASTGREVHGLDASAPMLEQARAKRSRLAIQDANRLHFHQGDMAAFELDRKFATIIIAFRSFQILLTTADQQRCLRQVRKHLQQDGPLIMNLFDPGYQYLEPGGKGPGGQEREFLQPVSGHRIRVSTLERENDPLSQTFAETWRFTETSSNGDLLRTEEETIRLKWTFRHEMRLLAETCGFRIEAEYSDFHRSAPTYSKEQIWIMNPVS